VPALRRNRAASAGEPVRGNTQDYLTYNRAMLRRAFAIGSLVGFVVSLGLWATSYLNIYYTARVRGINMSPQTIFVLHCGAITWPRPRPTEPPNSFRQWETAGFAGLRTFWIPVCNSTWTCVRIPFWMPTVMFCFLSWFSYAPIRHRQKRREHGLCVHCGYRLKHLSDQRCPECDTPFESNRHPG
jgi:hypothetical protein